MNAVERGAASVLAINVDHERTAFEIEHVRNKDLFLKIITIFIYDNVSSISEQNNGYVDINISVDMFKRVDDFDKTLRNIMLLVKLGGLRFLGTSPLHFSPFGDHGRYAGAFVPWIGALPERILFALSRHLLAKNVKSPSELRSNKLKPGNIRELIQAHSLDVEHLRQNTGYTPLPGTFGVQKIFFNMEEKVLPSASTPCCGLRPPAVVPTVHA